MDAFLQQFQHLQIQLEDITSATDNFNDDNCIGRGGFGKVYKGELSHSKGRSMVAIKRLDRRHGQGIPEFLKEITTLSRYSHENLISLLGFCYQGDEMILVYDYASRGSLDRYLNSPHLTWLQRLKICLDAAQGLRYLHDPRGTHQRLIHCDVKSANILLNEQWKGKLADFGLSIMGPANEQQSVIVTLAAGTLGYCDPQYVMTHTLTKESDVYSFGVVLFEVLCGRLCCTYSNGRIEQNLVRTWIESYEEKKLYDIIFKDTAIEPLEQSALEIFSDIAYRCLKESREDRPRMAEVVTELATALGYQKQFQDLKIPLEEITSATNHFNVEKNYIGGGAFGKVYRGEVSHCEGRSMTAIKRIDPKYGQGIPKFLKEIRTLSCYRHENTVSLLGFCYQGDEMILVYEHVSRGSLDRYLNSPHLTWSQRLKICLDAAQGLRYLHDPRGTHQRLIHCDVKSANILLDDQWNGKLCDFGLSIMGPTNEQQSVIVTTAAGTLGYCDPQYAMTHTLTKESDVYSFGVVLFEVLCGRLCCTYSNGRVEQNLVRTWIDSYEEKKLNDIIFKDTAIQPLEQSALETFSDIAYRCLKESREDRPRMAEVVIELATALGYHKVFWHQFQDLIIPLEEITLATDHFNVEKNYIGGGAFGKVYRGEVSHSKGRSMTAIKCIDPKYGQGIPKFLKEIRALSRYRHKNIVSLLGFCYQGDEMILVYEHVSRGSLERYLDSPHLTWSQRLKICLDAAKGLRYLHDQRERHQRLIHCDVKSANILLDDQWNAKVSDVGLSIIGLANEHSSVTVTVAAGTPGYCDPQYAMTHTLTKKSDVYSFGVVLFEVLCGRLCYMLDSKDHAKEILVTTWIKSYEQNKLNDIIFKDPTIQPLEQSILEIFSDIAYQCLKESREDRPKMAEVVAELERSLDLLNYLEFIGEWNKRCPLNYRSDIEPMKFQSKGILLNGGKTWFSLNKKGEHCEMISIAECLVSDVKSNRFSSKNNSRFAVGTYCLGSDVLLDRFLFKDDILKTHVKTQFLSPGLTYTVNLVFKFECKRERFEPISLKYRLQGRRESSISYFAYQREDEWWMCELYQFTCDHRIVDLQIMFESFNIFSDIFVEGIEFQPLENVENTDENQPISDSDSDANWEEKLPTDYEDIMKLSKKGIFDYLPWTAKKKKKKAYSILCKGFLTNDGMMWFSVDKNGKKCHLLSAKAALTWSWKYRKMLLPESRFGQAIQLEDKNDISIKTEVQSQLVSSETTYACYLVYKLPEDQSRFVAPVKVEDNQCDSGDKFWYIYLKGTPRTPVIRPKADQNTHNPLNRPKISGLPKQRNDGWIEVQIWEFQAATTVNMDLTLRLNDIMKNFSVFIIEGIEFRPI